MKTKKPVVRFIKSAVKPEDYPPAERPEVAFVGRSNAGKSSLLNALAQTEVAKVSQKPGKTRLLNFFSWDDTHSIVDIPGYGFAKRSHSEQNEWKVMIENYLSLRANLSGLVLVMDVRRSWQAEEEQLLEWWQPTQKPLILVLNKVDQLNQKEKAAKAKEFKPLEKDLDIHWISTRGQKPTERLGLEGLQTAIYEKIVKPAALLW